MLITDQAAWATGRRHSEESAMAADPLVCLSQVLVLAGSLIERVRPEQAGLPTPCRS
jgi:hypothetical protein